MKTAFIIIFIGFATILSGCEGKKSKEIARLKQEVEALKEENSQLKSGEKKLKSSLNGYKKFLQEINENLTDIDDEFSLVVSLDQEVKAGNKNLVEEIREHLENIQALAENSRLKVLAMDRSLSQLRKDSKGMSAEIMELDMQVTTLTEELLFKNSEIEKMGDMYALKANEADELRSILNRGYFIAADSRELLSLGVISKEGGFIGIGQVKMIRANSPDSLFTQIEKDLTIDIPLDSKKAQLISRHPDGSYEFVRIEGKIEKLVINDVESFWSQGNYLVIETD